MIRNSIRFRVVLATVALLAVVLVILGTFAVREMSEAMFATVDNSHRSLAKLIGSKIATNPSPVELGQWIRARTGAENPFSTLHYWVWGAGKALSGPRDPDAFASDVFLEKIKEVGLDEGRRSRRFMLKPEGHQEYRVYLRRINSPERPVYVALASPSQPIYTERNEFLVTLLIVAVPTIILAVLCAVSLMTWGLRPVGRTAERLRRVATSSDIPQFDLKPEDVHAELGPFVDAVGGLLGRLGQEIDKQKQFTGDAAHELRTPLAVAKSTVQLALQQDRQAGEYRQALAETLDDIERMERLINQMLHLARLDVAQDAGERENVRLDEVLRDVTGACGSSLRPGQKMVVGDLPEVTVAGHRGQLERLFANLLDNAVRHGPEEGTIDVRLVIGPEGACRTTIHDAGGEIPPDALERIFERFVRIDESRSRRSGGTGLGLAIARQTARRHGGTIRLRSTPGQGTDFVVELPCAV